MRLFGNRGGEGLVPNWRVFPAAWRWLPERAASIVGRYYPDTKIRGRAELLRILPRGGRGVEVGVWRGDFSEVLLHALEPEVLDLVDPWSYDPDRPSAWHGGAQAGSQIQMDRIHDNVVERFEGEDRVRVRRGSSVEVAGEFGEEALDWVYLDADHFYEGVRADLDRWLPRIRPGGFFCGDDYGVRGWWGDGVTRAVNERIRSSGLQPLLIYGGQYVLRKPAEGSEGESRRETTSGGSK